MIDPDELDELLEERYGPVAREEGPDEYRPFPDDEVFEPKPFPLWQRLRWKLRAVVFFCAVAGAVAGGWAVLLQVTGVIR